MPFKTVQNLDPTFPLDTTPGLDRFTHADEITRAFHAGLIERGVLPRYRGDEVTFDRSETALVITMQWPSQEVAQEYADFCTAHIDPAYLKSPVEVIEY